MHIARFILMIYPLLLDFNGTRQNSHCIILFGVFCMKLQQMNKCEGKTSGILNSGQSAALTLACKTE